MIGASVAVGFLVDDSQELSPAGIADGTGESTVFNHPSDVEVFDVDYLVLAYQRQGLFVVMIAPRPCDLTVRYGDFAPRFVSVG